MATLFAWHGQRYEGMGGQHIDVSILETQMASINGRLTSLVNYQYNGERAAAGGRAPGAAIPRATTPARTATSPYRAEGSAGP